MANKAKTREILKPIAKRILDSNRTMEKVHLCANGQGWTDAEKASEYAAKLNDDNVYTFNKSDFEPAKAVANEPTKEAVEPLDREILLARYKELSGKDAPGNIKDETLQAKVDEFEKQAETENIEVEVEEITTKNE